MVGFVYIINTWPNRPKFHAYGRTTDHADLSVCGQVLYANGQDKTRAYLRQDHAESFADPCRRCFE